MSGRASAIGLASCYYSNKGFEVSLRHPLRGPGLDDACFGWKSASVSKSTATCRVNSDLRFLLGVGKRQETYVITTPTGMLDRRAHEWQRCRQRSDRAFGAWQQGRDWRQQNRRLNTKKRPPPARRRPLRLEVFRVVSPPIFLTGETVKSLKRIVCRQGLKRAGRLNYWGCCKRATVQMTKRPSRPDQFARGW
jgi:hypothetical protein